MQRVVTFFSALKNSEALIEMSYKKSHKQLEEQLKRINDDALLRILNDLICKRNNWKFNLDDYINRLKKEFSISRVVASCVLINCAEQISKGSSAFVNAEDYDLTQDQMEQVIKIAAEITPQYIEYRDYKNRLEFLRAMVDREWMDRTHNSWEQTFSKPQ